MPTKHSTSTVSEVLSNRFVCPFPRIKIFSFILLACTDGLKPSPKIMAFLPQSKFGIGKSERESNPILYPEEYLLGLAFLVSFAASNKQYSRVNLAFKSFNCIFNS